MGNVNYVQDEDDSDISSSVARNAAISDVGSLWMNPTVSVRQHRLTGRKLDTARDGSRVENMRFSAMTPACVILFSSVLLPALVYPTRRQQESVAGPLGAMSLRWRRTFSKSFLSLWMLPRTRRLSVSI